MQYIELKEHLKEFTIFSLADIKRVDRNFHRRRLNEWQDKGYIKKVIRGYYVFSDLKLSEAVLFEIANKIYGPSYVSFEAALSYYQLIPETVYGITSASTRRTYKFNTCLAEFSYRTIRPGLFFGYEIIRYGSKRFKIASVEKALIDYFYAHPHIKERADFAGLRVNKESLLRQIDRGTFGRFLERFGKKTLERRVVSFLEFIRNA